MNDLVKQRDDVIGKANLVVITTNDQNEKATLFIKQIKSVKKLVCDSFDENIGNALKTHRGLVAEKKRHFDPLDAAERLVKTKIAGFLQAEEAKRQAEQRKKEEEARREEDRKRKIKEEQERQWREKEEAKRKEAEKLAAEGKAEEARKAQAEADKAAEKAEERAEEAEQTFVPVPDVESKVEEQAGVSTRQNWKFKIVDESLIPREYLKVDEVKIGKYVRAMQKSAKIAGVKIYSEAIVNVRA